MFGRRGCGSSRESCYVCPYFPWTQIQSAKPYTLQDIVRYTASVSSSQHPSSQGIFEYGIHPAIYLTFNLSRNVSFACCERLRSQIASPQHMALQFDNVTQLFSVSAPWSTAILIQWRSSCQSCLLMCWQSTHMTQYAGLNVSPPRHW